MTQWYVWKRRIAHSSLIYFISESLYSPCVRKRSWGEKKERKKEIEIEEEVEWQERWRGEGKRKQDRERLAYLKPWRDPFSSPLQAQGHGGCKVSCADAFPEQKQSLISSRARSVVTRPRRKTVQGLSASSGFLAREIWRSRVNLQASFML